jgi:hypothetical protein
VKGSRGGKNRGFFLSFITRQNKFEELPEEKQDITPDCIWYLRL